jgi:hypothetical protein
MAVLGDRRSQAVQILAAAVPDGAHWATVPNLVGTFRKKFTDPVVGVEHYSDYAYVTFSMAEVLFEGGRYGGISFGTERVLQASPGEYMRALQFTIACSELGYDGRAKVAEPFAPTPDNIAEARSALGLDS